MGEFTSIKLSGPGLHSGKPGSVEFALEPEGLGHLGTSQNPPNPLPSFSFPGFENKSIAAMLALPRFAERATILGNEPSAIRTPEHLLATLLFFADLPLVIRSTASELPGLDGSALPYRQALSKLFPECAHAPAWQEYPCNLKWNFEWESGHLRVKPAAHFRVHYVLEKASLRQSYTLENPTSAWNEILPARTFVFYRDWQRALALGLMAGAGLDSGLLLAETPGEHIELLRTNTTWTGGPFPLLNQPSWRMENEAVKHKILDLLGDLAIAGLALPKLDIEIRNGGHSINHRLLEKLSLN